MPETEAAALWLGRHRTLLVDGSGFSMPDTPELQSYFGQPGNQNLGCGFPVASIVAMFHAGTGFLLEVVTAALRTSEMALLGPVHAALDNAIYTVEALADLYAARWRVELNLRHLKQTMKMDVLKCMTVEGVLKELTVCAIVYNLVRVAMREAAARQGVDVERISFIDALRWLCELKADELMELVVNPSRPGRVEPRVRKRRSKKYPVMKKPRSELRKP